VTGCRAEFAVLTYHPLESDCPEVYTTRISSALLRVCCAYFRNSLPIPWNN